MAEDVKINLNRMKNKNRDGEDPVLVAQRFLNIFRQIHIFDEKRRQEFNQQILDLSPDIRGIFHMLPGGAMLQEYADDVVKKSGQQLYSEELAPKGGDILSAAMAETTPPAAPQQSAQVVPQIIQGGTPGKIVADENFAQALASAFARALQAGEAGKKEDLKELINAIRESKTAAVSPSTQPAEALQSAQPVATSQGIAKVTADDEFGQVLARSLAKAFQFSDANKKAEINELISAIRESKAAETPASGQNGKISADESFAQMLAQAFLTALEKDATNRKSELLELANAIREIKPAFQQMPSGNLQTPENIKVSLDENFAQTLAQSFAQALEISDANKKGEMQELISAIRESKPAVIQSAPVSGGEIRSQVSGEPLKVIADETFARAMSLSLSTALDRFGAAQKIEMQSLVSAIRESKTAAECSASGTSEMRLPGSSETLRVIADEAFARTISQSFASALKFTEEKRQEEFDKLLGMIQIRQQTYANSDISAGTTQVYSNDNLVREITSALSGAIADSSENRKNDTKEITQAIKEAQGELAKILLQNNIQNNASSSSNNANNIHINNAPIILPMDEIVDKVTKAQSSLLKELSQHQTRQLSDVISNALKESQELSSKTIVDTIKAFQEENLKLIRSLPRQETIKEIHIEKAVHAPETKTAEVIEDVVEKDLPKEIISDFSISQDNDDAFIENALEDETNDNESENPETSGFEEQPRKKKKKKKKKNKELNLQDELSGMEDLRTAIPIYAPDEILPEPQDNITSDNGDDLLDVSLFNDGTEAKGIEKTDFSPKDHFDFEVDVPDQISEETDEIFDNSDDETDFIDENSGKTLVGENEDNFDIEENSLEYSTEKEIEPEEIIIVNSGEETADSDFNEAEESPEPEEAQDFEEDISVLSEEADEDALVEFDTTDEKAVRAESSYKSEPDEKTESEPVLPIQPEEPVRKAKKNSLFDKINQSIKKNKIDFAQYVESEFKPTQIEEETISSADWGFTSNEEETTAPTESKGWEFSNETSVDEDEWEWEYEEDNSTEPAFEESGGEDWEWEYEEEPEEASFDGVEGEDWEWEYEEEDSQTETSPAQGAGAESEIEGEDWEWAYSEAFLVYNQELTTYPETQINDFIFSEDAASNNRLNKGKTPKQKKERIRTKPEIVIAELRNSEQKKEPYKATSNI